MPAYWHLLSLDAPTVAIVWCLAFAWAAHVTLPWSVPVCLALATWTAYAGDRFLDVHLTKEPSSLRARHHFYGRWLRRAPRRALGLVAATGAICLLLAAILLPPLLLRAYAIFAAATCVYFTLIHVLRVSTRFPKEGVVGLFFALGCVLPTWCLAPHELRLIPLSIGFALIGWLNCVSIERFEAGAAPMLPRAHPSTRWAAARLRALLTSLAALALGFALVAGASRWLLLALSLAHAALALLVVEVRHRARPELESRIWADAVLLAPLLWVLVGSLRA